MAASGPDPPGDDEPPPGDDAGEEVDDSLLKFDLYRKIFVGNISYRVLAI
jgi:hypothetical protein